MSAQLFDLKNSILTIGGLPMAGFGMNEAMTVEWADDVLYDMVTADGQVVVSRTNDSRMRIGLTFVQTSGSIPLLQGLLESQHGLQVGFGPPVIPPIPFFFRNNVTGDFISSSHTFFQNRISPGVAKGPGEVQYRLLLPQPLYQFGPQNVNNLVQP